MYFKRLTEIIKNQSYKNVNLIISSDTAFTGVYIIAEGLTPTPVKQLFRTVEQTFPWNLYLNQLMEDVKDGWILFIDDDDMYAHRHSLKRIVANLPDENSMLVWQMRFPDGRLVPDAEYIGLLPFVRKQIAMPCFAFHSKWKNAVRFDGQRAGDFRVANQLQRFLKVKWLSQPLVQLDNFGNVGKLVDLI
jgi:hypothetical protein